MTGAVEGGVQLATGFMDSLKREPLSLALVAMNLCLLAFFYFILTAVSSQREREIGLLYQDKKEVRELLAKCVVPPQQQRTDTQSEGPYASKQEPPSLPPIRPLPEDLFKQPE